MEKGKTDKFIRPKADAAVNLERISKLLAYLATKDMKQIDQVGCLRAVGFTNGEIAELLQTTQRTVEVTATRLRSRHRKRTTHRNGTD